MAKPSSSAAVPQRRDQQAQDDLLASGIARQKRPKNKCLGPFHLGTAKSFGMNADGTAIDSPKESAKRQRNGGCFDYADCSGGSDERKHCSNSCEATKTITGEAMKQLLWNTDVLSQIENYANQGRCWLMRAIPVDISGFIFANVK